MRAPILVRPCYLDQEEVLRVVRPTDAYCRATRGGAEVDLFFRRRERRIVKASDTAG